MQEAEIAALRASGRLGQLPESDRVRYLAASVRRAVRAFLARELAYQQRFPSSPALSTARERQIGDPSSELGPRDASARLVDVVAREEILEALLRLTPAERQLLDAYFVLGYDDGRVAKMFGLTAVAARQRKSRLVAKLRQWVAAVPDRTKEGGDPMSQIPPQGRLD